MSINQLITLKLNEEGKKLSYDEIKSAGVEAGILRTSDVNAMVLIR